LVEDGDFSLPCIRRPHYGVTMEYWRNVWHGETKLCCYPVVKVWYV